MSKGRMRAKGVLEAFCISAVVSLGLMGVSHLIRSDFIVKFLAENLAVLQITIIAINIPTFGIVLTNLANIKNMTPEVWYNIKSALQFSFGEQIAYLVLGLALTILCNGGALQGCWRFVLQTLQLSILGLSLATLVDSFLTVVDVTELIALTHDTEESLKG